MEKIRGIRKEEITDALSIACGQVEKKPAGVYGEISECI